jgi:hypothetical protein
MVAVPIFHLQNREMYMKQFIVVLGGASILLLSSLVFAKPNSDYLLLKESCGVYQEKKEYQDVDGKGVEIDNPYGSGKIKVKRTSALRTLRGLGTEKNTEVPDIEVPEHVFPLKVGSRWGDSESLEREDKMYFNYVEKVEDITVPAGTFKDCFKVVFRTLPDDTTEWFCLGVGIVKIEYHHHGTILDWIIELKELCK